MHGGARGDAVGDAGEGAGDFRGDGRSDSDAPSLDDLDRWDGERTVRGAIGSEPDPDPPCPLERRPSAAAHPPTVDCAGSNRGSSADLPLRPPIVPRLRLPVPGDPDEIFHPPPPRLPPSDVAAAPPQQPSAPLEASSRALLAHAARINAAMCASRLRSGAGGAGGSRTGAGRGVHALRSRTLGARGERTASPVGAAGSSTRSRGEISAPPGLTRSLGASGTFPPHTSARYAPSPPPRASRRPSTAPLHDRVRSSDAASTTACSSPPPIPRFQRSTASSTARRRHETAERGSSAASFRCSGARLPTQTPTPAAATCPSAFRLLYDQGRLPLRLHFLPSGAMAVRWIDEDAGAGERGSRDQGGRDGRGREERTEKRRHAVVSATLAESASPFRFRRSRTVFDAPLAPVPPILPSRRVSRERSDDGGWTDIEIRGVGRSAHEEETGRPQRFAEGASDTQISRTGLPRPRASSPGSSARRSDGRGPRPASSAIPVWRRLYQRHLDKQRKAEEELGRGMDAENDAKPGGCVEPSRTGPSGSASVPLLAVPRSRLPGPARAAELLATVLSGLGEAEQPYASLALLATSELLASRAPGFAEACVAALPDVVRTLRVLLRSSSREAALRGLLALGALAAVSDGSKRGPLARHVLRHAPTFLVALNSHVHRGRAAAPELHDAAVAALRALEDGAREDGGARAGAAAGRLIRRYVPTFAPRGRYE